MEKMIPVEQALEQMLAQVTPLGPEVKPILDCLGQVLSGDVLSPIDVPAMDNSAMDGFAIRAEDVVGASPSSAVVLRIIDQVAAGSVSSCVLEQGTAIRIMTGAALPQGADTVVPFEDTDELSRGGSATGLHNIGILAQIKRGANVRERGEDISYDELVLHKGTVLRPSEIGVLAALGIPQISVVRRPKVAILSTGDELVPIDEPLPPGKTHDANSYSIAALTLRYGGLPIVLGIGRDNSTSLNELLDGTFDADLLITSGGVSLGDYDVVKNVLADRGNIKLWTVCMKPGKPSAFGMIRRSINSPAIPHLGLPGNTVSSMVTFEQFARPMILKMLGYATLKKPTVRAIIEDKVINSDGRRVYARVHVHKASDGYRARLTGPQGSGILTSMAKANGLAIVPESQAAVHAGDTVEVQMLDWNDSYVLPEECR